MTTICLTQIRVEIVGLSPLIFQSKGMMEADQGNRKPGKKYLPAEEEAPFRGHWLDKAKKKPYIPSMMFYKSFCQAAIEYKQPQNKKKNMSFLVGATVSFEEEKIPLKGKYSVFEEWVRIPPRTGAAVKIGRPMFKDWSCGFVLMVDDEMWEAALLRNIITTAGKLVGIGAWRPGLKGPYGRFAIKRFTVL